MPVVTPAPLSPPVRPFTVDTNRVGGSVRRSPNADLAVSILAAALQPPPAMGTSRPGLKLAQLTSGHDPPWFQPKGAMTLEAGHDPPAASSPGSLGSSLSPIAPLLTQPASTVNTRDETDLLSQELQQTLAGRLADAILIAAVLPSTSSPLFPQPFEVRLASGHDPPTSVAVAAPPVTQGSSALPVRADDLVERALAALHHVKSALSSLSTRVSVSVPDIKSAICSATLLATSAGRPQPASPGAADDHMSVMDGSPFAQSPPGPWAVGRRPGDAHAGPLCPCGVRRCPTHFATVDVFEIYDMHCEYVCDFHKQNSVGEYVNEAAHLACPIHTKLALFSGAWVPWLSPSHIPTTQLRSQRIVTPPSSPEGVFITTQLAKGLALGLWERVMDPDDFSECSIIESAFDSISGQLALSVEEKRRLPDTQSGAVDIPVVNSLAVDRAYAFLSPLLKVVAAGRVVSKQDFAQGWSGQGGGTKHRLCVARNRFLNPRGGSWSMTFVSASAALETAQSGDVFMLVDHKSGYSTIPIRPDQRRYFCFQDPVSGDIYRSLRMDFGWSLAPGIFCSFSAEINAIIASRLRRDVGPRSISRYYIDDNLSRVEPGGGPAVATLGNIVDRPCSQNEKTASLIIDNVSSRANYLLSPEKSQWGSIVAYLGLRIDSSTRTAVVVPPKLFKALTMLHVVRLVTTLTQPGRIHIPRSFVLKMAGNMQWLAQNFHLGRLHTPALWSASELLKQRPTPLLNTCPGFADTLNWWSTEAAAGRLLPHRSVAAIDIPALDLLFSPAEIGSSVVHALPTPFTRGGSRRAVAVLTDVSGTIALGGCWRSSSSPVAQAFYALLTDEQRSWSAISVKELLAIVTWLERFGAEYAGSVVLFGTDNAGNVFTVNRLRVDVDDTVMFGLMSRLLASCDLYSIDCIVWWCPRSLNGISDDLSKAVSLLDACRIARSLDLVLRS